MEIEFYVSVNDGFFFGGSRYKLGNGATVTGRYKENGSEMIIEVEVRKWGLKKVVWVSEFFILFNEAPIIYNCKD